MTLAILDMRPSIRQARSDSSSIRIARPISVGNHGKLLPVLKLKTTPYHIVRRVFLSHGRSITKKETDRFRLAVIAVRMYRFSILGRMDFLFCNPNKVQVHHRCLRTANALSDTMGLTMMDLNSVAGWIPLVIGLLLPVAVYLIPAKGRLYVFAGTIVFLLLLFALVHCALLLPLFVINPDYPPVFRNPVHPVHGT